MARRGSVNIVSLVDPHHEIGSSRGRVIRSELSMKPTPYVIVQTDLGLLRYVEIVHVVQPNIVSF